MLTLVLLVLYVVYICRDARQVWQPCFEVAMTFNLCGIPGSGEPSDDVTRRLTRGYGGSGAEIPSVCMCRHLYV